MPRTANAASCRTSKLVVGTAADNAAAQARDGRVIQHRAERRRGEHVDVLSVDFLGCRDGRAVGGGGLRAAVRVKVTDHQCRPRCRHSLTFRPLLETLASVKSPTVIDGVRPRREQRRP